MDIKQFKEMIEKQKQGSKVPAEAIAFATSIIEEEETNEGYGKNVTIVGVARNAALGAVLVTESAEPIYIDGLSEWDKSVLGKKVEASGLLQKRKLAPDPVVDKSGGISHGMVGKAKVLEGAVWKVV